MEHVSPLARCPRINNVLDLIESINMRLAVQELLQTALTDKERDEMIERMVEKPVYEIYLREKLASVVREEDFLHHFSPGIRQIIKAKLDSGEFEKAETFLSTHSEAFQLYKQWRASASSHFMPTFVQDKNKNRMSSSENPSYVRTEGHTSHRKYSSMENVNSERMIPIKLERATSVLDNYRQLNRISEEEEARSRSQSEIDLQRLQYEMSRVMQKFRRDFSSLPSDITSCDKEARAVLLEFVESFQPLVQAFKNKIEECQGYTTNLSREMAEWRKAADLLCSMSLTREYKSMEWSGKKTSRSEKCSYEPWGGIGRKPQFDKIADVNWQTYSLPRVPPKPPGHFDWKDKPIFLSGKQSRLSSTLPRQLRSHEGAGVVHEIPIRRPLSANLSRPAHQNGSKRPNSVTFGDVLPPPRGKRPSGWLLK